MKKVTLGLLITFVAVAMVAGPKPTPTPAVQKGRGVGIAAHRDGAPTPKPQNPRDPSSGLPTGRDVSSGQANGIAEGYHVKDGKEVKPTTPPSPPGGGTRPTLNTNITSKDAEPTCCQVWNNKGECVKWGPQSGGCADTPRYVRTPTPAVDTPTTVHGSKSTSTQFRENEVEPTPATTPVGAVRSSKSKGASFRTGPTNPNEPNPTPIPGEVKSGTNVKSTKSTSTQFREGEVEPTPAEVQPFGAGTNVKSKGEGGKNDGEKHVTPGNGSERQTQQHSFGNKEGAPTTPTTTPGPVGAISLNSSRSNIYRQGAPVTVTPTSGPVEATTVKGSRSNGSERSMKTKDLRSSNDRVRPTPTPRKK